VVIPSKSVLAVIDLVFVHFRKKLERLISVKLGAYSDLDRACKRLRTANKLTFSKT
jgi:hypothetical protein